MLLLFIPSIITLIVFYYFDCIWVFCRGPRHRSAKKTCGKAALQM